MINFRDQTVLITGASGGIGSRIANRFAEAGCSKMLLTGRNSDRLNKTVEECSNQGCVCSSIVMDFSDPDAPEKLASFAEAVGPVDVLVLAHGAPLFDYEESMRINFLSQVAVANGIAKNMQNGSNIVLISSLNSTMSEKGGGPYCCAKAALTMFAKCAALDLGERNIRVNTVAPGMIDTPFHSSLFETNEAKETAFAEAASKCPLERNPTVDGVANSVLFLASDMASDITGTEIVVDCGLHCTSPI